MSTLGACACDDEIAAGQPAPAGLAYTPTVDTFTVKVNGADNPVVQPGSTLKLSYEVTISIADDSPNGWQQSSQTNVPEIQINNAGNRTARGNNLCPRTVSFDGPGVKVVEGRRSVTFNCTGKETEDSRLLNAYFDGYFLSHRGRGVTDETAFLKAEPDLNSRLATPDGNSPTGAVQRPRPPAETP